MRIQPGALELTLPSLSLIAIFNKKLQAGCTTIIIIIVIIAIIITIIVIIIITIIITTIEFNDFQSTIIVRIDEMSFLGVCVTIYICI